jgi:hypothetical protein
MPKRISRYEVMKSIFAASVCLSMTLLAPGLAVGAAAKAPPTTAQSTKTEAKTDSPSPAKLLADDPFLQTSVTLDVVEKPLGDVLADLSPTLKVDLTAERGVADQRVTLHVAGQPAHVVMSQLLALLSHDAENPRGYHWGTLERPTGERPGYQLWSDGVSAAQERDALDGPYRRLAAILRDMRRNAQPPPPGHPIPQGEPGSDLAYLDDPYNKAFRGLTDEQIDALVSGQAVLLDPSLFTAELTANKQFLQEGYEAAVAVARQKSQIPPIPYEPPAPAIRVTPADLDEEMGSLDRTGIFYLYLDGLITYGARNIDATSTETDPDPILTHPPADTGPQVDLTPFLSPKVATPQQRGDLGFTLQALAKAAHINVYQESFLRTSTFNGGDTPHPALAQLKGSLPRLIAQIGALWNYRAEQTPDGYLFWSRTWAQDRERDVPERLIAPWRKRLQENGVLSIYDRGEIDTALTWPQVALTLDQAIPEAGVYDCLGAYRLFNLFGSLTPFEQAKALSPDGLAVSDMAAHGQKALLSTFQKQLRKVPSGQVDQAVLKIETEDDAEMNISRLIFRLDSNGQRLVGNRCIMQFKAKLDKVEMAPAAAG